MASWKEVVGAVAPKLAGVLGGPLAGIATQALADKLLGRKDASQGEVEAAVLALSPAELVRLKEVEADLTKHLADLGIRLEELAMQDRDSARKREAAVKDIVPGALGFVIVGGFLIAVYAVITGQAVGLKDPTIVGVVGSVLGYISAKADQVVSYYYGSSSGSKAKTDALERVAKS